MATLNATSKLSWIDLYTSDTTVPSGYSLGMLQFGSDGKAFRYALAGASTLVVGNVLQAAAIDTQFDDMAVPAAVASGATGTITITNGTTAVTANQFDGGTAVVSVTPGLGEEYTILSHGTATSGASLALYLDRPIRTAWTTSTKITLRRSPWSGDIQAPVTTLTGAVAGIAIYAIPATTYGWVQTKGVGGVLSDSTSILVGSAVASPSTIAAGEMTLGGAATRQIGSAMRAASSGKVLPVLLAID